MKEHTLSTLYGMATIGAVVYFLRHAATFGAGVFGFIKGILWPGVLMYKLFEHLKL